MFFTITTNLTWQMTSFAESEMLSGIFDDEIAIKIEIGMTIVNPAILMMFSLGLYALNLLPI